MKLFLYHISKDDAHKLCRNAFESCGFRIYQEDAEKGFLSAARPADFPMPLACLTTLAQEVKSGVSIDIVSSFLSVLFGNLWSNTSDEECFVETILENIRSCQGEADHPCAIEAPFTSLTKLSKPGLKK